MPLPLREAINQAIEAGLTNPDGEFEWSDFLLLSEVVAGVAGAAAIIATGPAAIFLLAVAGAAGLNVVGIRISEGSWGWALLEGAFLFLDIFELKATINAVRLIRATNTSFSGVQTLTNAGSIAGLELADEFEAMIASIKTGDDALLEALGEGFTTLDLAASRDRLSTVTTHLENQAPTVESSIEVRRAYFEAVTRTELEARAAEGLTAIDGGSVEEAARQVVDAMFLSGRVGLDEAKFLDAQSFFDDVDGAGIRAWEIGGDDAVSLADEAKIAIRENCFASFSPTSQVVMANGELVPMGEVHVGDQVLSWGPHNNVTSGLVTATLPHVDVLLDVYLSDGSVLRVTEDHRFLSAATGDWIEIQNLAPGEPIVTVSGEHVSVTEIDWASAVEEPAFDLTVAESHNYVVVADGSTHQLVAHNETKLCDLPLGTSYFNLIKLDGDVQELLAQGLVALRQSFAADPVEGTRAVRAASEWAADNIGIGAGVDDFALRLLTQKPLWVNAAAAGGPDRLGLALDAALETPGLQSAPFNLVESAVTRADFDDLLTQHGTNFIAASSLWPAVDLSTIDRPLQSVLGEALERPSSQQWQKFDASTDNEFVQRLDEFGGSVVESDRLPAGSEGALFAGADETVRMKRWWQARQGDFPGSVELLVNTRAAVAESAELSARVEVVEVYEIGTDWIVRDFDPDSVELADVIAGSVPLDPADVAAAQTALDEVGQILSETTDPSLMDLRSKLRVNGKPNPNLHWSFDLQKILVIDMQ